VKIKDISVIFEDSRKILWLGSKSGLIAFDRKRKKIDLYNTENQPPYRILSNKIFSITEDSFGYNCVATNQGIKRIDRFANQVSAYQYVSKNKSGISSNLTTQVFNDKNNSLWICTDGGGINLYNRESDNFIHFANVKYDETSILSNKNNLVDVYSQDIL